MAKLLAALILLAPVPAQAFTGRVSSCHHGDTCRLKTKQGVVKVRLAEIDAPEIDQPYDVEAQRIICHMTCGRVVDVEPRGTSYDRIVGLIRLRGVDTSEAMVGAGAAWDYPQYDHDPATPALEAAAPRQGRGLWSAPAPIARWDWRHRVTPLR